MPDYTCSYNMQANKILKLYKRFYCLLAAACTWNNLAVEMFTSFIFCEIVTSPRIYLRDHMIVICCTYDAHSHKKRADADKLEKLLAKRSALKENVVRKQFPGYKSPGMESTWFK